MILAFLFAAVLTGSDQVPSPPPADIEPSTATEWAITATALAGAAAIDRWLQPATCTWCDRDGQGNDTLNAFDKSARDALRWSDGNLHKADVLSYVTEYAPALLLFVHRDGQTVSRALVALESLAATDLATGGLKVAFARERPNVHFAAETGIAPNVRDSNKSFPSGHASGAFALLFAMAETCRLESCSYERTIWAVGAPLAITTLWLRVAADQHYMTDVLAGAGVGAGFGWWLPQWRQRVRRGAFIEPSIGARVRAVSVRYAW
jgi:membrane-associated phospholipid phosphatase